MYRLSWTDLGSWIFYLVSATVYTMYATAVFTGRALLHTFLGLCNLSICSVYMVLSCDLLPQTCAALPCMEELESRRD